MPTYGNAFNNNKKNFCNHTMLTWNFFHVKHYISYNYYYFFFGGGGEGGRNTTLTSVTPVYSLTGTPPHLNHPYPSAPTKHNTPTTPIHLDPHLNYSHPLTPKTHPSLNYFHPFLYKTHPHPSYSHTFIFIRTQPYPIHSHPFVPTNTPTPQLLASIHIHKHTIHSHWFTLIWTQQDPKW